MATYTAASIALSVVPDLTGTFSEIDRKFNTYSPKPITPQVKPEVDDKAADELGPRGRFGAKALVAGAAVGAAIGGVISMALSGALDVAAAQGKLQAQLGGNNPQWAREMGAIAGKLYSAGYGENLETVNDALRSVIQSGAVMEDASNEQVSSVTSGVLNLAKAFGVDTAEAARAVGTVMRNGLAPDATTALDVITRGFQQGVDIGGDFLDTLNEYSGQFSKFGLDAQTATGLLSQGLQAGARDSDFVADALKEFSIRAVDGSKTTAQGFQALGLSADDMARKFGAGGQEASGALDLTLDKLREMPDPVQRSQAAVALFGTKAEDLGAALFALDPSAAAQGLGEVGGAAEGMGEALMTPADRIESLKRGFQMGLIDLIGGKLLPLFDQVMGWGAKLFGPAWEPVKTFLGFLTGTGGVVVAVIGAIAVATWAWTTASAALNLTLLANPLTWVIAGIIALVGFVIYAWNNFEWFRNAVMAVWDGLKAVGSWIAGVFVAIWNGLVAAVQWVGAVFTWLWTNAIKPAWDAISTAALWLWNTILKPVFDFIGAAVSFLGQLILAIVVGTIVIAWQALGAAVEWVWLNILKPTWDAIAAAAQWLWANVLSPVFAFIAAAWQATLAAIQWAWQNVLQPVWNAIQVAANWLWLNVLLPIFQAIQWWWNGVLVAMQWAWLNILQPVWNAVQAAAQWLWDNVLRPVFDAIRAGWDGLAQAFQWIYNNIIKPVFGWFTDAANSFKAGFDTIVRGITDIWNRIKEGFKAPVRFVLETVWNRGIGKIWDAAKGVGLPIGNFPAVDIAAFDRMAVGGAVRGPGGPTDDLIPALLSNGEHVLTAREVQAMGGHGYVMAMRQAALKGKLPTFAEGGPVNWQELWATVKNAFPGATLNSAQRPGDPGEHGAGRAIDVGGPMLAINRWIAANFPGSHELIHTPGINLFNGRPHTYDAATRAQHYNHVHWAHVQKGGSIFDALRMIAGNWGSLAPATTRVILQSAFDEAVKAATDMVSAGFPRGEGGLLGDMPMNVLDYTVGKVRDWVFPMADEMDASGGAPTGTGPVADQVRAVAARYGWDAGAQWAALDWLIGHESGWRPTAQNPTSTAYGLFQFLDSTWGTVGGSKTSNPGQQAEYGLRYIRNRYTDPAGAKRFWQANHWYDQGGWLPPGATMALNGTGKPEAILTHDQWQLLSSSIRGSDGAGTRVDLHAREPMSTAEITRLAHEIHRVQSWNARRR